ncbi:T9SS type A sorting domain-containing protein [Ilyomonas limi]|uniref:T9SS type A sorting domain-containing protein n=1 Tax=Ilyomonas limi TaxID=2575867 RepID=UPI00148546F9|nr:T9SS type A sorting domain-containing protein [Ilyomonas limi]
MTAPLSYSNNTFSIYPNPATAVLHIQNSGKATFILTDQSGKRLLTKTIEGNGDLNVANVPAGAYYITNATTKTTQKIVITK